ncbi:hypothetical protein DFJ73DRAFT_949886 [Zopfochytrium polystomum]|nr:hypothetical protein DFJ73DRAFT_949886 [Zopfochytrium polystomum]
MDLPPRRGRDTLVRSVSVMTPVVRIAAAAVAAVADTICTSIRDDRTRFLLATLFRLHRIQAFTLLAMKTHAVDAASRRDEVPLLEFFRTHVPTEEIQKHYSSSTFRDLLSSARLESLRWWIGSRLPILIEDYHWHDAVDVATLQLCNDSRGFELEYTIKGIIRASRTGNVGVLEWWRQSGLAQNLDHLALAVDYASAGQQLAVLEWWKTCGLEMKYAVAAMDNASCAGYVATLQWWKESALELKYTDLSMDMASGSGHVPTLQWWKDSGLELKYSSEEPLTRPVNMASLKCWSGGKKASYHSSSWWKESGLELRYTREAMDFWSGFGGASVLQWWKDSGLPLKYSENAVLKAYDRGLDWILDWWTFLNPPCRPSESLMEIRS